MAATFPSLRLRRLREHPVLRALVQEVDLSAQDLVYPLFIKQLAGPRQPVASMPGIDQIPLNHLAEEIQELDALGIHSVLLFGIPSSKDPLGECACTPKSVIPEAVALIRQVAPEMLIMVDLCLCEYTDHGHCGLLTPDNRVDNDATLKQLCKQAVVLAQAGAHVIAPSGMMDGTIHAVRQSLDDAGFSHVPLLSYSVKYHSSLYGPFRAAAEGAPRFGDRSGYQMNSANAKEALREVALDLQEGADMVMVKPAHAYLDVICRVKNRYPDIPLCAYHTSGEFAMIKAAAQRGWLNEKEAVIEILRGIRRAGADFIITYYAKEFTLWKQSLKFD